MILCHIFQGLAERLFQMTKYRKSADRKGKRAWFQDHILKIVQLKIFIHLFMFSPKFKIKYCIFFPSKIFHNFENYRRKLERI